ncbi:MAG TPA: hypothetical protein HA257_03915 [Candidatus Methanoperedenaceae archaeon]|nr:hypothetical protein [Candidatus Methanoperedenaceae archaeon]
MKLQIKVEDILEHSIVNIIIGVSLFVVSALVQLNRWNVLKNPVFPAAIGAIILLTIAVKFQQKRLKFLPALKQFKEINGFIVGISLLIVALLSLAGRYDIIRHFAFPFIIGIVMLVVTAVNFMAVMATPRNIHRRFDPAGLVGGEALVLYSLLLFYDAKDIAWSAMFPAVMGVAIFTSITIERVYAFSIEYTTSREGLNKSITDIEKNILSLRTELDILKKHEAGSLSSRGYDTLIRLESDLGDIRGMSESLSIDGTQHAVIEKIVEEQLSSSELSGLVGARDADTLLSDRMKTEIDSEGIGDIIREAQKIKAEFDRRRKDQDLMK